MRILFRTIPLIEIYIHLLVISLVTISYTYLFYAAYILPIPTYSIRLKEVYGHIVAPWPIFPGMGDIQFCYYGDHVSGFVSQAERSDWCQIDFDEFTGICKVFGLFMSDAERRMFYNTLDITGNGLLSWGELGTKMFYNSSYEDQDSADTVFIYYAKRWKHMKALGIGGGLERIQGFDYEPYRIDYTSSIWDQLGIWGPQGAFRYFNNHYYNFKYNEYW